MTLVQQETLAQLLLKSATESSEFSDKHAKLLRGLSSELKASPIDDEQYLEDRRRFVKPSCDVGAGECDAGVCDADLRLRVLTTTIGLATLYVSWSNTSEAAAKVAGLLLRASIRVAEQLFVMDVLQQSDPLKRTDFKQLDAIERAVKPLFALLEKLQSRGYCANTNACVELEVLLKRCPFTQARKSGKWES